MPHLKKSMVGKMKVKTKLDGKTWLRHSISVWSNIQKSADEQKSPHSAVYPSDLVRRLLNCYFWEDGGVVLDPFLGSGSTLVAACKEGLSGVGFEVVPEIAQQAYQRLASLQMELPLFYEAGPFEVKIIEDVQRITLSPGERKFVIVQDDARRILDYLAPESVNIVITSPPYWAIHTRSRSADRKRPRPYSILSEDLGNIQDYNTFLDELSKVFSDVYIILKQEAYCIVNVMDIRYKSIFIPYHIDIISRLQAQGFTLEDIIIWNRSHEYNNLRPIGYPFKFIVNKVHEYLLIFRDTQITTSIK
ncbi:MAG: DNA methyltransferase [Anaerolineae bacterium]